MRKIVVMLCVAAVSNAASAQLAPSSSRNFQMAHGSFNFPPNNGQLAGRHAECLIERKTGREVCHTRSEWRKIAAGMQKGAVR